MTRACRRAAILATVLLVGPAHAITRHVPSEYATINAALGAAVSGDSVLVAPGTYTDAEHRVTQSGEPVVSCAFLKGGVVLLSEAGPAATTIDMLGVGGGYAFVVLAYDQSEPTWIEGFTITGVIDGSNAVYAQACPKFTMRACVVRDVDARPYSLGALGIFGVDAAIFDSRFVNCQALLGGAIAQVGGNILIDGCYVEGCGEDGVFLDSEPSPPFEQAEIRNSEFVENWGVAGGALNVQDYGQGIVISGCTFRDNACQSGGGAVLAGADLGLTTVADCLFESNRATNAGSRGGAVAISGEGLVQGSTFIHNANGASATTGSDLWFANGEGTLENCIFANSTGGGAVATTNATVSSDCNVFWANESGIGDIVPGPRDRIIDPLFCDATAGGYTLMVGSPCLPVGSLGCGLIGAFGQNCGTVSLDARSWGEVKAAYRADRSAP